MSTTERYVDRSAVMSVCVEGVGGGGQQCSMADGLIPEDLVSLGYGGPDTF